MGKNSTKPNLIDSAPLVSRLDFSYFQHISKISNASGGQTLVRLSGEKARAVLMKSCPYDVHDRNFPIGKVVTTVFAKSQTTLRRLDENDWELVVRRSFADYVWRWLLDASHEFGLRIVAPSASQKQFSTSSEKRSSASAVAG